MTTHADKLADALEDVLASAHPNSVEHPTMHAAWQKGIAAIDAYRESLKEGEGQQGLNRRPIRKEQP